MFSLCNASPHGKDDRASKAVRGGSRREIVRRKDEAVTRKATVEFANFIAGRAVAARAGGRRAIENPATGAVYGHSCDSDAADVDLACTAAASAFPDWHGSR
jgi:hypothetical protein